MNSRHAVRMWCLVDSDPLPNDAESLTNGTILLHEADAMRRTEAEEDGGGGGGDDDGEIGGGGVFGDEADRDGWRSQRK